MVSVVVVEFVEQAIASPAEFVEQAVEAEVEFVEEVVEFVEVAVVAVAVEIGMRPLLLVGPLVGVAGIGRGRMILVVVLLREGVELFVVVVVVVVAEVVKVLSVVDDIVEDTGDSAAVGGMVLCMRGLAVR